jgi:hypothetical protein
LQAADGRQQIEAGFLLQALRILAQGLQRDIDCLAASGEGNGVAAVAGGKDRQPAVEGAA